MMKLRWWYYAFRYVPVLFAAWVCASLWPRFSTLQYGKINNGNGYGIGPRLPWWLSYMQTPDNSLDGDQGHRNRCPYWDTRDGQVAWLKRNPAYGIAYGPLRLDGLTNGKRTELKNGYRIDWPNGAWEHTRWLFNDRIKVRTGWLDGGLHGMFLLSIRKKARE